MHNVGDTAPNFSLCDQAKKTIQAYGGWKEKNMYVKTFIGINQFSYLIDSDSKVAKGIWKGKTCRTHARGSQGSHGISNTCHLDGFLLCFLFCHADRLGSSTFALCNEFFGCRDSSRFFALLHCFVWHTRRNIALDKSPVNR